MTALGDYDPIKIMEAAEKLAADPRIIYLAPECQTDEREGRLWCVDDVWSGSQSSCDDPKCKHKPTKYIIAAR